MTETSNSNLPAPYLGFGVFTKSIEILSETVVPSGPLDRRVLSGFSGGDYSALISGLRFLGLVDEERKVTPKYRELVSFWTDKAKFKKFLLEILQDRYAPIVGELDLKNGTSAQLEKAFRDYGVAPGQMLDKAIRFFVKAFTEAGVVLSPHMTAPKPRSARTTRPKKNDMAKSNDGPGHRGAEHLDRPSGPPHGFERLPLPGMPNSFIQYPTNLTEAHCQIIEAMVGVLKTSLKARAGEEEST